MVKIDFTRKLGDLFGKSEETKRLEAEQEREESRQRRLGVLADRYHQSRNLYMQEDFYKPLIDAGVMIRIRQLAEVGDGYQPNPNVNMAFIPTYDGRVHLNYKGVDCSVIAYEAEAPNSLAIYSKAGVYNFEATGPRARTFFTQISNEEWYSDIQAVTQSIAEDMQKDQSAVIREKSGTPFINYLHEKGIAANPYHVDRIKQTMLRQANVISLQESQNFNVDYEWKDNKLSKIESYPRDLIPKIEIEDIQGLEQDRGPSSYEQVQRITDDDLLRMYGQFKQDEGPDVDTSYTGPSL